MIEITFHAAGCFDSLVKEKTCKNVTKQSLISSLPPWDLELRPRHTCCHKNTAFPFHAITSVRFLVREVDTSCDDMLRSVLSWFS